MTQVHLALENRPVRRIYLTIIAFLAVMVLMLVWLSIKTR